MNVLTLASLAAPFVLPRALQLAYSWLHVTPKGTRTPLNAHVQGHIHAAGTTDTRHSRDNATTSVIRLAIASVAVSLSLVRALTAPHNLFLSLAPSSNILHLVLPVLRTPLDVRTSTDSLARAWLAKLGRSQLDDDQLALLGRMQTLEARMIYIAHGKDALLNCHWCNPTLASSDFLILTLVSLVVHYLVALGVVGFLTTSDRIQWRRWLVGTVIGGALVEVWSRLNWRGSTGGQVVMINAECLFVRHCFLAATFALSYFAKPKAPEPEWTGTVDVLQGTMQALSDRSGLLLDELQIHETERRVFATNELLRQRVLENSKRLGFEIQSARSDSIVREARDRATADAVAFDEKVKTIYCRGEEPEPALSLDHGPVLAFRQFNVATKTSGTVHG
ncbi:hypothetical protein ACM66B_004335 [Microbotryomycetes sp. NB124-2]